MQKFILTLPQIWAIILPMANHELFENLNGFSLSHDDWSLQRKGIMDQERHNEKVREHLKKNIGNIVTSGEFVVRDSKTGRKVRIPIKGLEEYHFRFDPNQDTPQVGQGEGNSKVGDVVGKFPTDGISGQEGGNEPGEDMYEMDLSYLEFRKFLFDGWELPNFREVRQRELESTAIRFSDIRKSGAIANLDKRRTIRENIKRNAMAGNPHFGNLRSEDLRFRTWEEEVERQSNAVVIGMMDISSSMGGEAKRATKSLYKLNQIFLDEHYSNIETVHIVHHTQAIEVDEDDFYLRSESGGTHISSAYKLAEEIINSRYNRQNWNIYLFHVSDGDNVYLDNKQALESQYRLASTANLFSYIQFDASHGTRLPTSGFYALLRENESPNTHLGTMNAVSDAYKELEKIYKRSL